MFGSDRVTAGQSQLSVNCLAVINGFWEREAIVVSADVGLLVSNIQAYALESMKSKMMAMGEQTVQETRPPENLVDSSSILVTSNCGSHGQTFERYTSRDCHFGFSEKRERALAGNSNKSCVTIRIPRMTKYDHQWVHQTGYRANSKGIQTGMYTESAPRQDLQ